MEDVLLTMWASLEARLASEALRVDAALSAVPPSQVAIAAGIATLSAVWVVRLLRGNMPRSLGAAAQAGMDALKRVPGVAGIVRREKQKIYQKLQHDVRSKRYGEGVPDKFLSLPSKAVKRKDLMGLVDRIRAGDQAFDFGDSPLSGAVYFGSQAHADMQTDVYAKFVAANPIHADSYPSVARMEAEVIAMTARLLDGGRDTVVGSVTSGGSESILCAMKASRDWWLARRAASWTAPIHALLAAAPWSPGEARPQILMADSAHAAYVKAAEYFHLTPVVVRVGKATGFRLTARAVRRHMTAQTAIVVCSAPSYPHGCCDEVDAIASLCARAGCACHVDACLGGFVLPFAAEAGFAKGRPPLPSLDFSNAGVTSMSVDTHKYGLAHKGTSVVLYKNKELRARQFTRVTDWSGGLYISPTMAGSRSGAVIAAAWASLLAIGRSGFVEQTRKLLTCVRILEEGIESIDGLELLGAPHSTVIAWGAAAGSGRGGRRLDIYRVNDLMTARGWNLACLQRPAGLHMCVTPAHAEPMMRRLVDDLRECVAEAGKADPGDKEGNGAIYGMAEALPDRHIIGDVLVAYQEATLDS